jgi:hypothetical protein
VIIGAEGLRCLRKLGKSGIEQFQVGLGHDVGVKARTVPTIHATERTRGKGHAKISNSKHQIRNNLKLQDSQHELHLMV